MFSRRDQIAVYGFPRRGGGALVPIRGKDIFVWGQARSNFAEIRGGNDGASGKDWDNALLTMGEALRRARTGDRINMTGKFTEQLSIADTGLTDLNLKFDITIQGVGSLHHADQPGSGSSLYDHGACVWQPAASPETTTPNLSVYGRGWKFYDILFDGPADAACVRLVRNSSSGTDEYDAGHASFVGCDFRNGLRGIEDSDGNFNVLVQDCVFETFDATTSGAAIITVTNTGVAATRRWRILDNYFQPKSSTEGNERHIVMALNGSLIKGNTFGTVKGTGLYVDLNNGAGNVVTENVLMGLYDTTDYRAGTGDVWYQNWSVVKATTSPDGTTISNPAA